MVILSNQCVAGGWAGGTIKDNDFFEKFESM